MPVRDPDNFAQYPDGTADISDEGKVGDFHSKTGMNTDELNEYELLPDWCLRLLIKTRQQSKQDWYSHNYCNQMQLKRKIILHCSADQ